MRVYIILSTILAVFVHSQSDSVDFIYPLENGTTWTYSYFWSSHGFNPPHKIVIRGIQTWKINSSYQNNDSTVYQLICFRTDTSVSEPKSPLPDTTTTDSISFTILTLPNYIYVNWDTLVRFDPQILVIPSLIRRNIPIPRHIKLGESEFYAKGYNYNATYVSGLGLKNITSHVPFGANYLDETLDLILFNNQPVIVQDHKFTEKIPKVFLLEQNYPNPFNPATTIEYHIARSTYVNLAVLDILGREILTLVSGYNPPGIYSIRFDASGLSSGIYFICMRSEYFTETKKMIISK